MHMTAYINNFHESGQPSSFHGEFVADVPAAEVTKHFEGWEPDVLLLLQSSEVANRWAIHVVNDLPTYVGDRVCLVGDAAHAMTPHLGLGGNQGIHDAYVLAELLADPQMTPSNLSAILSEYDSIRRPVSQEMARASFAAGRGYQLSGATALAGPRLVEITTKVHSSAAICLSSTTDCGV